MPSQLTSIYFPTVCNVCKYVTMGCYYIITLWHWYKKNDETHFSNSNIGLTVSNSTLLTFVWLHGEEWCSICGLRINPAIPHLGSCIPNLIHLLSTIFRTLMSSMTTVVSSPFPSSHRYCEVPLLVGFWLLA